MSEEQDGPNVYNANAIDEGIDQWMRELLEVEASHGVSVVPAYATEVGNFMVNVRIIERTANWEFSEWFPLENQQIDSSDGVDHPGIYDIGLAVPVPRLNGESEIIYIGRAAAQRRGDEGTIRGALRRHVGNGCPSEKWFRLLRPGQQLIARFAIADDVYQARYWEKLRIRWFIEQHWELPAGNTDRFRPGTPIDALELLRQCRKWRDWAYSIS